MKPFPDVKKVIAAYRMHGSLRKASTVLHLSFWKTRRLLLDAGFPLKPSGGLSHRGKKKFKARSGSFAVWIKTHPEAKLPLDLDAIVAMTGCSKNAIKCTLYRLRKQGKTIPRLYKKKRGKHGPGRVAQAE